MSEEVSNSLLIELVNQFEQSKNQMQDVVSGLTAEQFNKRPSQGGWSIGECIDHLNVTDKDYTSQIEEGINKAVRMNLRSNGDFKVSWFAGKFIQAVEPPVKRKLTAPGKWTPASDIPMEKAIKTFNELKDKYIELLEKSKGVNIGKVRIQSPATKLIRFPLYVMFRINSAHQRRHLWQAGNVKKEIVG